MCIHVWTGLTIDNVRKTLHGIPWYKVGEMLSIPLSKLHEIEQEYSSDEEREVAVIRYWILRDPFASWRRIMEQLEWEGKHDYSNRICHYSEELTGMGMRHIQCMLPYNSYMIVGVGCPLHDIVVYIHSYAIYMCTSFMTESDRSLKLSSSHESVIELVADSLAAHYLLPLSKYVHPPPLLRILVVNI